MFPLIDLKQVKLKPGQRCVLAACVDMWRERENVSSDVHVART